MARPRTTFITQQHAARRRRHRLLKRAPRYNIAFFKRLSLSVLFPPHLAGMEEAMVFSWLSSLNMAIDICSHFPCIYNI